ncbi:MAG: SpoIIE family protein phosphatase [Planctomycetota bacterium]
MKILLADDDEISRILLQFQLEEWGHSVVPAENGLQAWELLQTTECQIVITDWMMPEMSGIELLRKIRSSDFGGYVYVILLTSKSDKKALVTGLAEGADDFLTKPVDPHEMQARLQPSMRIFDLERRLAERNRDLESRNQQLSETNARTKRDLNAAAQIQQSLLPGRVQDIPGVQFAWHYSPCNELAGDMLNVLPLDDDHIGIYMLDVSGHGVQASLMAVSACQSLACHKDSSSVLWSRRDGSSTYTLNSPALAVELLNSRFVAQASSEQYFTLVYGILNSSSGEFRYTVAGHPAPIHISAGGSPHYVPGDGLPVGIVETPYEEHSIQLEPGERLFFYSDGLTESMNTAEELFGGNRLLRALESDFATSVDASLKKIVDVVSNWVGDAPIHDDLSLLALEFCPISHLEHANLGDGRACSLMSLARL